MRETLAVILKYNKPFDTFKCVSSLVEHEKDYIDILVIDNGSNLTEFQKLVDLLKPYGFELLDVQVMDLKNEKPRRIIHRNNRNLGYSAGSNVGLRYGCRMGYKYIATVNNDILFVEPVFDALKETLEKFNEVAVVAPRVLDAFGRVRIPYFPLRRTSFFETLIYRFFYDIYLVMLRDRGILDTLQNSELALAMELVGCFLLFKSEVLEKIDFLDENVFLYGEEHIIFDALDKIGLRGMINNRVKIFHLHRVPKNFIWRKCGLFGQS